MTGGWSIDVAALFVFVFVFVFVFRVVYIVS
jgi:hypothetical protein